MIPNHGPMMDFGLGETADAIRDTTARFAADRIAPLAAEIDASNAFPRQLWPAMGELGLHGITVEEDFGGLGLGLPRPCRGHGGGLPRLGVGGPQLRRPFQSVRQSDPALGFNDGAEAALSAGKLISGEHVGALAMSEAGAGSDVMSMGLRADRRGDRWVLNGAKFWITNGPHADVLVVYAKTDPRGGRAAA